MQYNSLQIIPSRWRYGTEIRGNVTWKYLVVRDELSRPTTIPCRQENDVLLLETRITYRLQWPISCSAPLHDICGTERESWIVLRLSYSVVFWPPKWYRNLADFTKRISGLAGLVLCDFVFVVRKRHRERDFQFKFNLRMSLFETWISNQLTIATLCIYSLHILNCKVQ